MVDRSVAIRMSLDSAGLVSGARNATLALQQLSRDGIDRANTHLGALERSAQAHPESWQRAGRAALGFGTAVGISLGAAAKAAISWQSDWTGVLKTVDGTGTQLARVETGLRGMTRQVSGTHTEIAAVAEAAGQLGIATDNVVGFTRTMIDMGESTNLSAEQAATSLARFSNIMGTSQTEAFRLGASIVGLGNNFATTESEIMDMAMRLAGAGRQAGLSEGDVLGLSAALSSVGIEAEAGGTAVSLTMKRIGREVDTGGGKLGEFARIAGMSSAEFSQAWKDDAGTALAAFVGGLDDAAAKGESANSILTELGITGIRESDAMLRLSAASEVLTAALATGNEEYARGTALIEESSKRYETAEARITMAGNAIKDSAIDFGQVLLPAVAEGADGIAELASWFQALPTPVKEATVAVAGVGSAAALATGGFLTLAPGMFETWRAVQTMRTELPGLTRNLTRAAKVAGVAALAYIALAGAAEVAARATSDLEREASSAQFLSALAASGGDVEKALAGIDAGFKDIAYAGNDSFTAVDDLASALDRIYDSTFNDKMNTATSWLTRQNSSADKARAALGELDIALNQLATGGNFEKASEGFRAVWAEAEANGQTFDELMQVLPEFRDTLTSAATAAGLTADEQTLLKIATGEITPEMLAAAGATDEQAKQLQDLGLEAETAEQKIASLAEEIRGFGSAVLDERAATRDFEQALNDAREAAEKNGRTLDETSQKGRDNASALDRIAQAANNATASMLENGASADEVAAAQQRARDDLYDIARAFGMSKDEADAYVDAVMLTPDEVRTRMQVDGADKAKADIDKVKDAADRTAGTYEVKIKYITEGNLENFPEHLANPNRNKGKNHAPGVSQDQVSKERVRRERERNKKLWKAQHDGGLLDFMEAGGLRSMDPIAQVVSPNTWRVVGDRMDVPESYIPLDGSRRSLDILAETIRRMPNIDAMASGGIRDARADEARRRREEAAREEAARRARLADLRTDARTDLRRGNLRDQVTGGLSGAYSAVDRLRALAGDDALTRGGRGQLSRSSGDYERSLRSLYGTLEKLDGRLEKAKKKLDELKAIQDSVATSITRNAYSLDVTSQWTQGAGGQWSQTVGVSGVRTNVTAAAARAKELAGKLNRLQKMGYAGAILQEIASAGSIEASLEMADALLQGSGGDVRAINSAYGDIEKYAAQAGKYVTNGFHKGGVDAAAGLVKGLESQQKTIEATITKIARGMEGALKRALGIKSPSRVMYARGIDTVDGLDLALQDGISQIEDTAARLGLAAIPGATDLSGLTPTPDTDSSAPTAGASGDSTALASMPPEFADGYAAMDEVVLASLALRQEQECLAWDAMLLKQTETLAGMQVGQLGMLKLMASDQLTHLQLLAKQSSEGYTGVRDTAGRLLGELRTGASQTSAGIRRDYGDHLSQLNRISADGHAELTRVGVAGWAGIRSGMNAQMRGAQPELVGSLNRLIGVLGKFTGSVNTAYGDVGVKLKAPGRIEMRTGGVLPGYTPGLDVHEFHSPTAGRLHLSGGEAIMRPEWTRLVGGEAGVKAMNDAARRGDTDALGQIMHFRTGGVIPRIPGVNAFADSGIWRTLFAAVKDEFPSVKLHSAYRPGSITATGNRSRHGLGQAVDISPRMDVAEWIRREHGGAAHELIYTPMGGRQLYRGRPHRYGGVTARMHNDHIHWSQNRPLTGVTPYTGGTDMGGYDAPAHPFLDRAKVKQGANLEKSYMAAARKLNKEIIAKHTAQLQGEGLMRDLGLGVMNRAAEGLVRKAGDFGKQSDWSGMPGGSGVARWRDTVIEALRRAGLPTTDAYIEAWLRQIGSESGGNPSIKQQVKDVNSGGNEGMGLVQVIPGTFKAFRDKSLPNDRTHPLANLVAGMNWAKFKARRQGRDMLDFIGHGHGYAEGTESAMPGWKWVGENGPELVKFKGGEPVVPNKQAVTVENQLIRGTTATLTDDAIAHLTAATKTGQVAPADLAKALDGIGITLSVDGQQMTGFVHTAVGTGYADAQRRTSRSSTIGAR